MDLRQLECFVAVAEELHFRKAGERLGLSQSALSDRISALEHELGLPLLFRTTRQVSVTQAGADFLRDAKKILADVERSVSNAKQKSAEGMRLLRISGVDEAISMVLPVALVEFRKEFPQAALHILEISSSDQHAQELINHRADVAFVRSKPTDDFLDSTLLHAQPVVVAVADTNPLARREILSAHDIIDEPIVGYPRHARPILHDMLWSGFRAINRQPNIVCEVIDKSTLLQFVTHGLGIGLAPAWVKEIAPPGVSFVPYENGDRRIELHIACRATGNSQLVTSFIAKVKMLFEDRGDLPEFN